MVKLLIMRVGTTNRFFPKKFGHVAYRDPSLDPLGVTNVNLGSGSVTVQKPMEHVWTPVDGVSSLFAAIHSLSNANERMQRQDILNYRQFDDFGKMLVDTYDKNGGARKYSCFVSSVTTLVNRACENGESSSTQTGGGRETIHGVRSDV